MLREQCSVWGRHVRHGIGTVRRRRRRTSWLHRPEGSYRELRDEDDASTKSLLAVWRGKKERRKRPKNVRPSVRPPAKPGLPIHLSIPILL